MYNFIKRAFGGINKDFYTACESGSTKIVKMLLDQKDIGDINKPNMNGETALFAACKNGHTEIVKMLLDQKDIDINKPNINSETMLRILDQKNINKLKNYGKTALVAACENGHAEIVKLLLDRKDIDINKPNEDGETALFAACENGHAEIVKLLLDRKDIDINKPGIYNGTALVAACENGHAEIVKLLLDRKDIDINKSNEVGGTALFAACKNSHTKIVKLLLDRKDTDINKLNKDGKTALFAACENGHIEIVKLLLDNIYIDINKSNEVGGTALFAACKNSHIKIVKLLLDRKNIDINKLNLYNKTALFAACENGHTKIVKLLLDRKDIDINKSGIYNGTALFIACKNGHTEIVKLLLDQKNIDINKQGIYSETALFVACENGHTEIVKLLLDRKDIDINKSNKDGETTLIIASKNGHIEIVKLLLSHINIGINISNKKFKTALIFACEYYRTEVVKLLLDNKNIKVDYQNNSGATALIHSSVNNSQNILKLLLERTNDVNHETYSGITSLIIASHKGNKEIVKLLLSRKDIDVNHIDYCRCSALIYASYVGNTEVVKLLLQDKSIDINYQTEDGFTALIYASQNGHAKVVSLLLECNNINVNQQTKDGFTALSFASKYKDGFTVLSPASKYNYKNIEDVLSEHNCIGNSNSSKDSNKDIKRSYLMYPNIDEPKWEWNEPKTDDAASVFSFIPGLKQLPQCTPSELLQLENIVLIGGINKPNDVKVYFVTDVCIGAMTELFTIHSDKSVIEILKRKIHAIIDVSEDGIETDEYSIAEIKECEKNELINYKSENCWKEINLIEFKDNIDKRFIKVTPLMHGILSTIVRPDLTFKRLPSCNIIHIEKRKNAIVNDTINCDTYIAAGRGAAIAQLNNPLFYGGKKIIDLLPNFLKPGTNECNSNIINKCNSSITHNVCAQCELSEVIAADQCWYRESISNISREQRLPKARQAQKWYESYVKGVQGYAFKNAYFYLYTHDNVRENLYFSYVYTRKIQESVLYFSNGMIDGLKGMGWLDLPEPLKRSVPIEKSYCCNDKLINSIIKETNNKNMLDWKNINAVEKIILPQCNEALTLPEVYNTSNYSEYLSALTLTVGGGIMAPCSFSINFEKLLKAWNDNRKNEEFTNIVKLTKHEINKEIELKASCDIENDERGLLRRLAQNNYISNNEDTVLVAIQYENIESQVMQFRWEKSVLVLKRIYYNMPHYIVSCSKQTGGILVSAEKRWSHTCVFDKDTNSMTIRDICALGKLQNTYKYIHIPHKQIDNNKPCWYELMCGGIINRTSIDQNNDSIRQIGIRASMPAMLALAYAHGNITDEICFVECGKFEYNCKTCNGPAKYPIASISIKGKPLKQTSINNLTVVSIAYNENNILNKQEYIWI